METARESLMNADIAFSNKKYEEALAWYQKALAEKPNDTYALSRAGAICVSMGQFDSALKYFKQAKELDPQNGDNHFNYANACFFKRDSAGAFSAYVDAEKAGCSEDVTPRLYYQMAMLCSLRQDVKSALVYFQKCAESDSAGTLSLSPDFISEKLKLYMLIEDYSNAEKMAAQLVAIQPTAFRSYMVYYSILLAHKNFSAAERLLADAKRYAEQTEDDRINLVLQTASLYIAEGEAGVQDHEASCRKAVALLESLAAADDTPDNQLINVLLTLSEAYQKADMHDKAIVCLNELLNGVKKAGAEEAGAVPKVPLSALTPEEIDEMIRVDTERIQELIYSGEIDGNLGAYAQVEYDEAGYPVNVYDENAFLALNPSAADPGQKTPGPVSGPTQISLSPEQRERVLFLLLTSYLAKDKYASAGKIADLLMRSSNKHYAYYGRYVSALSTRKIGMNPAVTAQKYAEALAFFRNKMFADHSDSLAAIFRARLYAEDGKIEKAKEIAQLLAESDQKAILEYIDSLAPGKK